MVFHCMVEFRRDVDSVLRELKDFGRVGGGLVENKERRSCKARTQMVLVAIAIAVEERDQQMASIPAVRNLYLEEEVVVVGLGKPMDQEDRDRGNQGEGWALA